MSSPTPQPTGPVGPDTLITVKVVIDGQNRRFKLALRDLGAHVLPQKLRFLLAVPPEADVKFDRFSDSAGAYVTLDSTNPSIYKQLYRAAKAKLKLRLRATITMPASAEQSTSNQAGSNATVAAPQPPKYEAMQHEPLRPSYLQTVLAPSSHGSRTTPSAPPSTQSLYASAMAGMSSFEAAQRKEMQDLAKLRLEAELHAEKERAAAPRGFTLPARPKQPSLMDTLFAASFAIDCNNCNKAIANEHYHCSICDAGDFDLCQACVDSGITCDGKDHWLIKRIQRGGSIIPSTTETIAPKAKKTEEPKAELVKEEPVKEEKAEAEALKAGKYQGDRTCNACINEYPGNEFVSCDNCSDFDLCLDCFAEDQHGHHPAHSFHPVSKEKLAGCSHMQAKCDAGRGVVHDALCDGCDKTIVGVRHKCLNCPDWDYCSTCYLSAEQIHPGHRFAPLYETLAGHGPRPETHYGIYCDGPLCAVKRRKNYIRGDRFKCVGCMDTDFCANCEAAPTNEHNKTHPLIKFKTPVRHVSVTTLAENDAGGEVTQLGDIPSPHSSPLAKDASTETAPAAKAEAAAAIFRAPCQVQSITQVETVAETEPAETKVDEKDLQAWFESDTTPDGSEFASNRLVAQSWTIRNPGPHAWPAGCAVYYVGGDDMRNLDTKRPSSVSDVDPASHSNVLEKSLEPHQTAVFNVLLKSPAREGRVISYWRLKTPQGKPFGHKLWVDITVVNKIADEAKAIVIDMPPREIFSEIPALEGPKEETSQMIFPKLEKESPVSSVHDVSTAPVAAESETDDLLDDVDSLESDDGFMTDEEYDILDASDEDYLMAQSQMVERK